MQLHRAKELFMEDSKFKRGFRFDHIWPIVKDFEKFKDNVPTAREVSRRQSTNYDSSQSDNPTPQSPLSASPGLSSFSPNFNDDDFGGTSSQRPVGVKKAKLKRKKDEQMPSTFNKITEQNEQLMEMLKKTSLDRQAQLDIQRENLALRKMKEENKILLQDLDAITDPRLREFLRAEQEIIMQRRSQQHQQGSSSATNAYGNYFDNLGGSGTNLPDY